MANPSIPGAFVSEQITYAPTGLSYQNPSLNQYTIFESPTSGYESRRIDVSSFAEFGFGVPWPFTNENAPLNGMAWLTSAGGAAPLMLIAHGNHSPLENSTPGYEYLCAHLASHGIHAASIDVNFLNGFNSGENDARAIVQLEHIRLFLDWNADPEHSLFGRIDPERIIVVGHSRGGEAVGHASLFNRLTQVQPDLQTPPVSLDGSEGLGPYHFGIRGAVAIAPTDQQYVPLSGPVVIRDNYYVLHGSRDNDVFNFPGNRTYDRAQPLDLTNPTEPPPGNKSLLWIYRANHNYFNSTWQQEASSATTTLERAEQEQIAKTAITSMARAEFFDDTDAKRFLRNHAAGQSAGWLPSDVTFVSQHQSRERLYLQHSEEAGMSVQVSLPATGSVNSDLLTASKTVFDLGSTSHLFQDSSGVRLHWQASGARFAVNIDPTTISINDFGWLGFRVGQSFEPANTPGQDQDFQLVFEDHATSVTLLASAIGRLPYPDQFPAIGTEPKTVLQSFAIPLADLRQAGLAPRHLRRIVFRFDQTSSGVVYLDDLQLFN